MDKRIAEEFELLKLAFPTAVYQNRWILLPEYSLPDGWSNDKVDIAFHLREPYPANSPYGIYAPVGLSFNGNPPANYKAAQMMPPFPGSWAIFSWEAIEWFPGKSATSGHNLKTWAVGINRRFIEGI